MFYILKLLYPCYDSFLYQVQMQRLQLVNQAIARQPNIYDYIVVGAGISGLQAADILTSKPNLKILILQAQPTVGGRVTSLTVADLKQAKQTGWIWKNIQKYKNVNIQVGATWIQEDHKVIRELCNIFGISLRQQYSHGTCTYLPGDFPLSHREVMNSADFGSTIEQVIQLIDDISQQYNRVIFSDLKTPSPQAKALLKKYDGITVQNFLKQIIPQNKAHIRDLFDCFLEHTECISGQQNSMHEVLTKNARSNDLGILKQFLGNYGHAPSFMVNGGTGMLIKGFIHKIQKQIQNSINTVLRLNQQVLTIDNRRQDFITVISENTLNKEISKLRCRKVICSVPLAVSRMISFTKISPAKRLIIDNQLRTDSVKSFMIVKSPFWRRNKDGSLKQNGDTLFSSHHLVNFAHDISPVDESCGIMVFFKHGKRLDAWQTKFPSSSNNENLKKQYFIDLMCKMYAVKKEDRTQLFEDCIYYEISYMENQFIRSGFQSNTRPGTFNQILNMGDSLQALYRDENGITFVGSEYSLQFASYLEGAVRITRQKTFDLIGDKDPLSHLFIQNLRK